MNRGPVVVFQSPLGAAIVVAVLFPRLGSVLTPLLSRLQTPKPDAPPVPAPSIQNVSLQALKQVAMSKYPWLSADQAVQRFAVEAIDQHEKENAKAVEQLVKTTPADRPSAAKVVTMLVLSFAGLIGMGGMASAQCAGGVCRVPAASAPMPFVMGEAAGRCAGGVCHIPAPMTFAPSAPMPTVIRGPVFGFQPADCPRWNYLPASVPQVMPCAPSPRFPRLHRLFNR